MEIQQVVTALPPGAVIDRAVAFFTTQISPYTGFVEEYGPTYARFRVEAGSLSLTAAPLGEGRTVVRGSTSRLHRVLSMFLATLVDVPEEVAASLPPAELARLPD